MFLTNTLTFILTLGDFTMNPKKKHRAVGMKPPLRRENSAKTDGHPLRCARGVWEKDPKRGENRGVNP